MTVGERIKQKRLEKGMSVDELAAKLGKNRATIYRYESNDIENLPITILGPISEALNVSPTYLMGYEDDPNMNTQTQNDKKENSILKLLNFYHEGTQTEVDPSEIEEALCLFKQYKEAIPQVQNAVDALLKPSQPDS